MRGNRFRGAWLVAAWLALAPAAFGQGYAPASPQIPVPLGSTRPEDGGFFVSGGYNLMRMNNPLKSQTVAVRGFLTYDDSLPFFTGPTILGPNNDRRIYSVVNPDKIPVGATPVTYFRNSAGAVTQVLVRQDIQFPNDAPPVLFYQPGQFVGSGVEALNVNQLTGQDYYNSGFNIALGWKFDDGSSLSLNWKYLTESQYRAGATLTPRNGAVGIDLADSFLFSPVYNFPPEYSGPDNKVVVGGGILNIVQPSAQVAYGVWNASSIQTIEFRQRFQQWDITYREPIYETEDYRLSGIVGPRFAWIWERFKWRTTSYGLDTDGNVVSSSPDDAAVYTNITSNRMYGAFTGCEQEFYLGRGFAFHLKGEATLFVNSVKERAKYELDNRYAGRPENKIGRREWTVVPGFNGAAGLMWYPTEFVQVYAGYEFMTFLNTLASRRPIDFDYSNLQPKWSHYTRVLDGFQVNLAFRF